MAQEGLKARPTNREMVLAIKSVEALIGKNILPEGVEYEDVLENWKSLSEKYPLRAQVFKDVLKHINAGGKADKKLAQQWKIDLEVPEGYMSLNTYLLEKDPEGERRWGSSGPHALYSKMYVELRAMAREEQFKNQHTTMGAGGKNTASNYYSLEMLDECYRRILKQ